MIADRLSGWILNNDRSSEDKRRQSAPKNPPRGLTPLDKIKDRDTRKSVERGKRGLGVGPKDWVGVTPDGHIYGTNPETGDAEFLGNVENM